jgi:hypothetical protein
MTGESMDHLLFHCDMAFVLWSFLYSVVSRCLGLCLDGLSTCLLVGGPLKGQGALQFGKWHLFASFGAYGGKETIGVLRIWKVP